MMRTYRYVGPPEIKAKSVGRPAGRQIRSPADVLAWFRESGQTASPDELVAATFVIDLEGRLRVADRRSEHVACAAGHDVLAAGEIFFAVEERNTVFVAAVTNQSTGYCPEPSCWDAVAAAFDQIGLEHPPRFTTECVFRKCVACGARNIVKDGWFNCDVCGQALPPEWNFD